MNKIALVTIATLWAITVFSGAFIGGVMLGYGLDQANKTSQQVWQPELRKVMEENNLKMNGNKLEVKDLPYTTNEPLQPAEGWGTIKTLKEL